MQNPTQSYKNIQINTTDRGEIIIMLYDGALRFLARAKEKMLEKDMAAKGLLISKAIDIISELDSSLNMEAGESLAQNLRNIYFLCNSRLLMANLKLDIDTLDSVVTTLKILRDAFFETMQTEEAKEALKKMGPHRQTVSLNSSPNFIVQKEQGINTGVALSRKMAAYGKSSSIYPSV